MSRKITCAEAQASLIDLLAEEREPSAELAGHLATCDGCAAARNETAASWQMFRALPPLEPPPALRNRALAAVLGHMTEDERLASRRPWIEASRVPLAVASGLLVAAASLLLLGLGELGGDALPHPHVFFCAAIFTGLLVGAFSWIYSATTVNGLHLDAAARIGVLALAITVAGTTACPEFHVLAWWDRSGVGRWLSTAIGIGGSSLAFGFAYGLVPGFLAALFGGRMLAERPGANALVAAGVVFLLATPVIYLQSVPFTSGVIASWVAGIATGTLCGVGGALRVRQRVAQPA